MVEIELLVNDKHVDTNGAESLINITYTFSDLSEPDKITDTYSKTITLPGTDNNNKIFGQAWMVNSLNVPTFNPSLRNSFVLTVNRAKFLSGYIKLNSIKKTKNVIAYNVTLYGDVTNYFNKLSDTLFRTAMTNSSSWANVSHVLTPEYVSNSWDDGAYAPGVTYVPCNNGAYDDFDLGSELNWTGSSWAVQKSQYYIDNNPYEFDSIEWQRNEFRISKQRPGVQVSTVMNALTAAGNDSSTDCYFSDSFADENPYWNESVMTLPLMSLTQENLENSSYSNAAFVKIVNDVRYNTLKYRISDSMASATYNSSRYTFNGPPIGNGRVYDISVGVTPAVNVLGIFDSSTVWSLADAAPFLEDSKSYTVQITAEYLMSCEIEMSTAIGQRYINALFTDSVDGNSSSYTNYSIALNFYSGDQSLNTFGWMKTMPYFTFRTSSGATTTSYPSPWYGNTDYAQSSNAYGDMKGEQIYSCWGSCADADSFSSSGSFTASVRMPFKWSNGSLKMVCGSRTNYGADICPWDVWRTITFYGDECWNVLTGEAEQFATDQFTSSITNPQYMAKPMRYISTLKMTGAKLKTFTDCRMNIRVWKPGAVNLDCRPSAMQDDVTRANALLSAAGYSTLSAGTVYHLPFILNLYITSVYNGQIGSASIKNNYPSPQIAAQIDGLNNYWNYAGFKLRDLWMNGITPENAYIITPDLLIDSETSSLDVLVNYTKMFGLLYEQTDVDSVKNINICTRNEYFSDYQVLDWSDKVDYSQEMTIEPVTFTTKWLSLMLNSNDSYYENKYYNKYGVHYGEAKINTGYQFNSDTEELLKDTVFNSTTVSSEFNWFYGKDYAGNQNRWGRVAMSLPPCPAYFDKDNGEYKGVDTKYNFLFDTGLYSAEQTVDGNLYASTFFITPDSSLMYSLDGGGKPMWYSYDALYNNRLGSQMVTRTNYRRYSTFLPEDSNYGFPFSWDFMKPQENYQGITDSMYPAGCTIYERYWKRYIEEIYNVNNKKVTMWILLSPEDMLSFSFKNFISINGTLYHVNKITDYNPAVYQPVQVEMITVQDITAYTEGVDVWGDGQSSNYNVSDTQSTRALRRSSYKASKQA